MGKSLVLIGSDANTRLRIRSELEDPSKLVLEDKWGEKGFFRSEGDYWRGGNGMRVIDIKASAKLKFFLSPII